MCLDRSYHMKLISLEDAQYDVKRQIFNSAIDFHPAAIAVCESSEDVVEAVQLAKANDWTVAVRGGGHHLAGFAVAQDSLVIDLSAMKQIVVNEETQTVSVEAGIKAGELTAATQQYGLAVPLGTASATGVFGVALGGGLGYLRGVHGLSCDNIIGATVVTAAGDVLEVSETAHADLLWALRGGGGNFGVVTKLMFQAYPIGTEVLGLDVMYDYADAKEIFTNAQRYIEQAPDEGVAVNFTIATLPPAPFIPEPLHFKTVVMVLGMYVGDPTVGEAVVQPLRQLATPIVDQSGIMPYTVLQQKLDPMIPERVNCYGTSLFFDDFTEATIDELIDTLAAPPVPGVLTQIWSLGGKMNNVSADHAAFATRDAKWLFLIDAMAMNGEDAICEQWIDALHDRLLPISHEQTSYLNAVGVKDYTTANAYKHQLEKLTKVKATYDPTNTFCNNHTIEAVETV